MWKRKLRYKTIFTVKIKTASADSDCEGLFTEFT